RPAEPSLGRLAGLAVRAAAVSSAVPGLSSTAADVRARPAAGAVTAPPFCATRGLARLLPYARGLRPASERAGIGPVPPSRTIPAWPGRPARSPPGRDAGPDTLLAGPAARPEESAPRLARPAARLGGLMARC